MFLRIWLPGIALMTGWNVAWVLAWQNLLFDAFARSSSAGVTAFANTDGRALEVWITAGIGFVLGAAGLALLASSSQVFPAREPLLASRLWRIGGIALTLAGLSLLILFPSTISVVIDEPAERVAVETRWLYWKTAEALAADDVERVSFRDYRLSVGPRPEHCKVQTGLSIVDHNRNALAVPAGFDHEAGGEWHRRHARHPARGHRRAGMLMREPDAQDYYDEEAAPLPLESLASQPGQSASRETRLPVR